MDLGAVNRLIGSGELPNLARIYGDGCWAELEALQHSLAETSQVLGITGCSPEKTGYWGQNRFIPERMTVESPVLYDFERQPPFFALGDDCRTVAFDLPQLEFHPEVNGVQVAGWGAHSPMSELRSDPPRVATEIVERDGKHPLSGNGYALIDDADSLAEFRGRLLDGLELRRVVVDEMIQVEEWDLFLTWISETHQAGHYFWPHEDHAIEADEAREVIDEVYRKTDETIGSWMKHAGPEVDVVVYSLEGMKTNTDEVPSIVLLAEWALARRFGRGALEFDPAKVPVSPEKEAGINDWVMELWNQRKRTNRAQEWLRRHFSPRLAARFDHRFGGPRAFQPEQFGFISYQHVMWISPYWPSMPVFALPSFSDGFLRINVKGRERPGLVSPKNYAAFADQIEDELCSLQCAETGRPVVDRIPRDDGTGNPAWANSEWRECARRRSHHHSPDGP